MREASLPTGQAGTLHAVRITQHYPDQEPFTAFDRWLDQNQTSLTNRNRAKTFFREPYYRGVGKQHPVRSAKFKFASKSHSHRRVPREILSLVPEVKEHAVLDMTV